MQKHNIYSVCYHHYHNRKEGAKVRIEEGEDGEEEDVQRILQQRKKDNLIGEI